MDCTVPTFFKIYDTQKKRTDTYNLLDELYFITVLARTNDFYLLYYGEQ